MPSEARRRRRGGEIAVLRGLLVEPATTNYLQKTVDASDVIANSATVAGGQGIGAGAYGVRVTQTGATVGEYWPTPGSAITAGVRCVASCYWHADTATSYRLLAYDQTNGVTRAQLTWDKDANGAPTNFVRAAGDISGSYPCPSLGPGWYRIYVSSNAFATTSAALRLQMGVTDAAGLKAGLFALPQIEDGTFPSSPIPNASFGVVSRAKDSFTSLTAAGLWAASAGTYIEDSMWLMDPPGGYAPLTALGPPGAGGSDTQVGTRSAGALVSQAIGGTLTPDLVGQYALVQRVRTAKTVLLGGGNHRAVVGATLLGTVTNVATNADTLLDSIRDNGFACLAAGIIYQLASYNVDLGNAAAQGIDAGGFVLPSANRTKYLDFRAGSLGEVTVVRSSTGLDDRFNLVAANQPRFAAGLF